MPQVCLEQRCLCFVVANDDACHRTLFAAAEQCHRERRDVDEQEVVARRFEHARSAFDIAPQLLDAGRGRYVKRAKGLLAYQCILLEAVPRLEAPHRGLQCFVVDIEVAARDPEVAAHRESFRNNGDTRIGAARFDGGSRWSQRPTTGCSDSFVARHCLLEALVRRAVRCGHDRQREEQQGDRGRDGEAREPVP